MNSFARSWGSLRLAILLGAILVTAFALYAAPILPEPMRHAALAQAAALARFQAFADSRARSYERTQDISTTQLLILLDVAERTGYSLGQLLATGEHESAHTWNDFVRPPLSGGRLGAAAGVWQFQPRTFERVLHLYGDELLDLTAADPEAGRRRLDLRFGPFCDSHVRLIIRDTIAGLRDPHDPELKLLRHNFTVLALAKYLLAKDSGAADPVEDYLFHFLGPAEGRRILTLARGDDRDTRVVKPPPTPPTISRAQPDAGQAGNSLPGRPTLLLELAPRGYLRDPRPGEGPLPGARVADPLLQRPGEPPPRLARPRWAAPHGYEHDSPVVTGNIGMFYRDGRDQSDPYTWAEFLDHLARRVKADQQPELVRAKYGVGFAIEGGDMPRWAFDPAAPGQTIDLHLDHGSRLPMPKARLTAPLTLPEMRDYQRRLLALIGLGQDRPTAILSDAAARALHRLGLLSSAEDDAHDPSNPMTALAIDMGPGVGQVLRTDTAPVREALHAFRELVGKAPPDDPLELDLLFPAERAALEVYGERMRRFIEAAAARAAQADTPARASNGDDA
jgi:hypothetical protein